MAQRVSIILEAGVKPTDIDLGTTNNSLVLFLNLVVPLVEVGLKILR